MSFLHRESTILLKKNILVFKNESIIFIECIILSGRKYYFFEESFILFSESFIILKKFCFSQSIIYLKKVLFFSVSITFSKNALFFQKVLFSTKVLFLLKVILPFWRPIYTDLSR